MIWSWNNNFMIDKKIIVLIPAYNAQETISKVFNRIPKDFLPKVSEFLVINDGSSDSTLKKIESLKSQHSNITIINKQPNEGYAKAQKTGFKFALEKGADIVILLHADGQYAPEEMPRLVQPLIDDEADIVQGSRILGGGALKGGMPLYKYIANVLLSWLENICYGMKMGEYHSGYMLYSRKALETIPFEKLSDTFHIDGEMLFVGNDYSLRIKQVGNPTCYAGETSSLKPIKYGLDVLKIMLKYKLGKYNFKK